MLIRFTIKSRWMDGRYTNGTNSVDRIPITFTFNFAIIFYFQTNTGPILLAVNPHTCIPSPQVLSDERKHTCPSQLKKVVLSAVRQQLESGHSQAILLK